MPVPSVARLKHVTDSVKSIARVKRGRTFGYETPGGTRVRAERALARIRALAIPPAWTDVWICASPDGHIQAAGRDARGRKQYRYHPAFRARRDETKYGRLAAFGRALPKIRARVRRDLRLAGLPRQKVLAAVVQLLGTTFARVGNDEYAKANKSFGLATLRDRHATIRGGTIRLRFRGKGGKVHELSVNDARLARVVRRCRDLPGQRLFQFVGDDGRTHAVGSSDVNAYIRSAAGTEFTAKDFRTWGGTRCAAMCLIDQGDERPRGKRAATRVISITASVLGNTPAICRKSYIHPSILEIFDGETAWERWRTARSRPARIAGLSTDERILVRYLESAQ